MHCICEDYENNKKIHGGGEGNEEEMSWKKRKGEFACENGTIPMENMLVEVVELKYAGNMGKRSKGKMCCCCKYAWRRSQQQRS
jgi:hypothetical protein